MLALTVMMHQFPAKVCQVQFLSLYTISVGISTPVADCDDGEVRLADGNTQYEGRVEVCINRVWGTVCSRDHSIYSWLSWYNTWGTVDSNVVCRQVGHMELGTLHDLDSNCMLFVLLYISQGQCHIQQLVSLDRVQDQY